MKKVFLTFGDGNEAILAARKRVACEASILKLFDEVVETDWGSVSPEVQRSPLRDEKRGCGFWVWKPDVIRQALSRIDYGDILIWSDAGNVVHNSRRQWKRLFARLDKCDILLRRIRYCALRWTSRELLDRFALEVPSCSDDLCYQYEGSFVAIKKTRFSEKFVEEWWRCMVECPSAVCDVAQTSLPCQNPSFVENRHDQSVLTLLAAKYRCRPETRNLISSMFDFHFGIWPFGNPAISIVRHKKGSPVRRISIKERLERAGLRIAYGFVEFVERRGYRICWSRIKP